MGITPNHTDEHFMRLALAQAQLAAAADEVPVGAVLVHQQQVIAQAHNQVITQNRSSAHAEVLVLEQAGQILDNYRLVDCELYVTLEPCTMCAGALVHARIKRLIFGAYDHKTGVVASVDRCLERPYHNHQVACEGGVLQAECSQMLSAFFAQKRAAKKSNQKL